MTALPVKDVIPRDQALLFVQETRDRFTIVTLTEDEYFSAIEHSAALGLRSGTIYDGLFLQCAVKAKAEVIYTWNLRHFRAIRPEMTGRMRTP